MKQDQPAAIGGARWVRVGRSAWTLVDESDYDTLSQYSWCRVAGYAGRMVRDGEWRGVVYMHRQLMGATGKVRVDHRNGDKLDNRRSNLRLATQSENLSNRGRQKNNASGFKGVHLHRSSGLWVAKIMKEGKNHPLGYFKTPEEGAAAYAEAAKQLHGEFARVK